MSKRCKICGVEYTFRCWNSKFHIYIQEHYEQVDRAEKLAKIIGGYVDEARQNPKSVGRSSQVKSTTRSSSSGNREGRKRLAGTLSIR